MKINDIEAHIRSQLSNHTEHRSDAPLLWENISRELEQAEKKDRFPFWLWLGLPLILLAVALAHTFYHSTHSAASSLALEPNENQYEADNSSPSLTVSEGSTIPSLSSLTKPAKTQTAVEAADVPDSSKSIKPALSLSPKLLAVSSFYVPPTIGTEPSKTYTVETSKNIQTPITATTLLSPLSTAPITPIKSILSTIPAPLSPSHAQARFQQNTSQWSLLLHGGLQYTALGLSATAPDANPYLQQLETSLAGELGWYAGLEVQQMMGKGIYWSTGFLYTKDWLKLDNQRETVETVLKENVLLKVTLNAVTRDTLSRLYGDREVEITTQQRVVHHNSLDWISLPLSLGWQRKSPNWTFGLDLGVQFHFLLKQQGRMFNPNGEFFYFDDINQHYKNFGYAMHLRPKLEYHFTPKLGLVFQPMLNLQLNNQLLDSNISARSTTYRASLGLRFNW